MTLRVPDVEMAALGVDAVVPGYVDLQINGVGDVDFSTAVGADWERAGRRLLVAGVTEYLATICSMPLDRYAAVLDRVAAAQRATRDRELPEIVGVHLEGPFLGGALGAHPAAVVRPLELEWLVDLLDAFPGLVRVVTLAPEADPTSVGIRALVDRGVVVSLGHSTCSYEDAVRASAAGATLTTHLFNGMGPLHHRSPGIVGAALDPRTGLTPTVIADLVHVHPAVLSMAFAAAEPIVVSDAVATGVRYFDVDVTATGGAAYLSNGTLTGATSLLDDAVRNLVSVGVDRAVAQAAASTRPGSVLGRQPRSWIGVDEQLMVRAAWRGEELIFRAEP